MKLLITTFAFLLCTSTYAGEELAYQGKVYQLQNSGYSSLKGKWCRISIKSHFKFEVSKVRSDENGPLRQVYTNYKIESNEESINGVEGVASINYSTLLSRLKSEDTLPVELEDMQQTFLKGTTIDLYLKKESSYQEMSTGPIIFSAIVEKNSSTTHKVFNCIIN